VGGNHSRGDGDAADHDQQCHRILPRRVIPASIPASSEVEAVSPGVPLVDVCRNRGRDYSDPDAKYESQAHSPDSGLLP